MPHRGAKIELYDLKSDSGEENNVAVKYPEIVERLKGKLTDIVLNGRTTEGKVQKNDTGHWKDLAWITEGEYDTRQAKGK